MRIFLPFLFCLVGGFAMADDLPPPVTQALAAAGIPAASVAIVVQQVDAATPRLAHNADAALNPASTIKLLTTFAALDLLGPAHAWKTEAFAAGPVADGVLAGDLVLRGSGDPKLGYERFWRLLREVRMRGVREIRGDLVLDRGAFAMPDADPGQFDGQPLRPYNVAPDALLLNFKAVTLHLTPRDHGVDIWSEPTPANLDLVNQIVLNGKGKDCGDWRERLRADVFVHGEITRVVLTGSYPAVCGEQRWNVAVMDHPRYVLGVFRQLWQELGGVFDGGVRDGPVAASARPLAVSSSPTLAEIVRDINKFSNNVMARQLYLTLGAAAGHLPAHPADAAQVLRDWLAARRIAMPELVLENGSGLSRLERISAASLSRLLLAAWHSAVMPEFIASLPVTAVDGTMRKRLASNGVAGRAHIKTGYLDGVRSIAGYVLDRAGRRWAVVFIANHPRAAAVSAAQDALLQWLYEQE